MKDTLSKSAATSTRMLMKRTDLEKLVGKGNLNIWVALLKKELPSDAFEQIYLFYNRLIVNIPVFTALTDHDVSAFLQTAPDSLHKMDTQS